jgi:hypothetical protein
MLQSDKKRAILITAILAIAVVAAIPSTQAGISPPEPDLGWENTQSNGDVTDVAIGDLIYPLLPLLPFTGLTVRSTGTRPM